MKHNQYIQDLMRYPSYLNLLILSRFQNVIQNLQLPHVYQLSDGLKKSPIVVEVVDGEEDGRQKLVGGLQVVNVGPRVFLANVALT